MSPEDVIRGTFAILGAGVCVSFIAIIYYMVADIIEGFRE